MRRPALKSPVSLPGRVRSTPTVFRNFVSQLKRESSASTSTRRIERRYSIACWPHFAQNSPQRGASQFSHAPNRGSTSRRRRLNKLSTRGSFPVNAAPSPWISRSVWLLISSNQRSLRNCSKKDHSTSSLTRSAADCAFWRIPESREAESQRRSSRRNTNQSGWRCVETSRDVTRPGSLLNAGRCRDKSSSRQPLAAFAGGPIRRDLCHGTTGPDRS
jgi:hypothetical protein